MAGGAGLAIGAVGSLINMGAQQRAANSQRRQIDMQIKQAQSDYRIQRERFEVTKAAANDAYFRERVLLDSQRDLAALQQQEQVLAQESLDRQLSYQQVQLKEQAEQQIQSLLQAQANASTNAELAQGTGYRSLATRFMQSEELGNRLYTELTSRGVNVTGLDEARRLEDIQALQSGVESINTVGRQDAYTQSQLEGQQGLVSAQASTASEYLKGTREYQRQLNDLMNRYGAKDREYTYQRNLIAAEANQYAQQAGILAQEGASATNLRNQLNQLNMSSSQIRNPNWLGGILSIGAQFAPQIGSAVEGLFNQSTSAPPPASLPHIGVGGILTPSSSSGTIGRNPYQGNYNPGIITDVTGNYYG
jgi:hypothetical protein